MTSVDDLLTPEQVATYLQVDRGTVYRYIRDGRLAELPVLHRFSPGPCAGGTINTANWFLAGRNTAFAGQIPGLIAAGISLGIGDAKGLTAGVASAKPLSWKRRSGKPRHWKR